MKCNFDTGPVLTHMNAKEVLQQGFVCVNAGAKVVDCAQLVQFDSSALAVLLAWRRAARARDASLGIINLPAELMSLAQAYGVDALLTSA